MNDKFCGGGDLFWLQQKYDYYEQIELKLIKLEAKRKKANIYQWQQIYNRLELLSLKNKACLFYDNYEFLTLELGLDEDEITVVQEVIEFLIQKKIIKEIPEGDLKSEYCFNFYLPKTIENIRKLSIQGQAKRKQRENQKKNKNETPDQDLKEQNNNSEFEDIDENQNNSRQYNMQDFIENEVQTFQSKKEQALKQAKYYQ